MAHSCALCVFGTDCKNIKRYMISLRPLQARWRLGGALNLNFERAVFCAAVFCARTPGLPVGHVSMTSIVFIVSLCHSCIDVQHMFHGIRPACLCCVRQGAVAALDGCGSVCVCGRADGQTLPQRRYNDKSDRPPVFCRFSPQKLRERPQLET